MRGYSPIVVGVLIGGFLLIASKYLSKHIFPKEQRVETVRDVHKPSNQTQDRGQNLRILCLILATSTQPNATRAVNQTWAKRCTKHFFIFGGHPEEKIDNDRMLIPTLEGIQHLTTKVLYAFKLAFHLYGNKFDWIVKADDDSYIIMENLRYLLSDLSPKKPAYLGLAMKVTGTPMLNTLDNQRKETFHHVRLERYLLPPHNHKLYQRTWNGVSKSGSECCSKFSICFHNVIPEQQFVFEHILYNTRVYKLKKEEPTDITIFNTYALNPRYT